MTIGHLIETLGGKAAASTDYVSDGTPFGNFSMTKLQDVMRRAGYQQFGHDAVYCGKTGRLLPVLLFTGVISYQRLKHMVEDKIHARATGPHDLLTRQPMRGRSKEGGGKLGPMELDGLGAHGIAHTVHERTTTSSDGITAQICQLCGGLAQYGGRCENKLCAGVVMTTRPLSHTFVLLLNELRAMGIKVSL